MVWPTPSAATSYSKKRYCRIATGRNNVTFFPWLSGCNMNPFESDRPHATNKLENSCCIFKQAAGPSCFF